MRALRPADQPFPFEQPVAFNTRQHSAKMVEKGSFIRHGGMSSVLVDN
jgi:hypothetical protein